MPIVETAVACVACSAVGCETEPFYYLWHGRKLYIYRCPVCTHQFVWPSVTADDQATIYGNQYFARGGDWLQGMHRGMEYAQAEHLLRAEARQVLSRLPGGSGRRLLDVGCAGGVLLDEAQTAGFDVEGLEINRQMAEHAFVRFGVRVMNGRVEDVERNGAPRFDVVTLCDVLEHIPRPLVTLQKLHRWMNPGGVVFVRGPLNNSPVAGAKEWLRRMAGVEKELPGYPLDANTFNPKSLTAALQTAGFSGVRWITQTRGFGEVVASAT